ncbi:hypothetical protein ACFQU9_14555 [Actinomadura namibiensis]|uniref:Transposase n=1 Tax=Actinomadura namibiensis TaxID=182080 RepID=A0A7W3M070_ACTNM|nr:hypothetical protein [Actinomadura namibiensis]MBA8957444.1 hypothetical protein [Actinomadura namibiensis]
MQGKIRRDPELKEFIQDHLDQSWSPEQISQALRTAFPDEPDRHLAHKIIYQAIYLPHHGGLERKAGTLCPDQRATRYVKLLHLPDGRTADRVRDALLNAFADLRQARGVDAEQVRRLARTDRHTRF